MRMEGGLVNHKRVQRIWRSEGLKVPKRQPKRARLWFNDGSCIRLRPERKNHVWAYDFIHDRTHDGRSMRMLTIVDEYTRESLAIDVARKLNSEQVEADVSLPSRRVTEVLERILQSRGSPVCLDRGQRLGVHFEPLRCMRLRRMPRKPLASCTQRSPRRGSLLTWGCRTDETM